ncbi:hypothetical protein CR513_06634, partial [Mucuna pruriens]
MKGIKEFGGVVSALTRSEESTAGNSQVLPKKSLNCGDLELTGMTIQLANRSIVQALRVLEDVLVQVNELIFPVDFYVLDMEGETSGKESTLIIGRPFVMTARTKIDVHAGTLSMGIR